MITIRSATTRDIEAIDAIYEHWVLHGTATFEIEPPGVDEMKRRLETICAAGYPYLVAENEAGRILGYAYASAYRPRIAYRATVEDSVYIDPEAVGTGIGRALVGRLIEDCTALGFRQMVAVIGDSAQMGSIRLHRALGFTFVGTLHSVGYKFDRWLDTVIMQLALGQGDQAKLEQRRDG